jgi:hydroxymethylpyrimidine/phosphomethylpyrimidine kinase
VSTHQPAVLSIAGFDPSAATGVTADLKTFAAFDVFGAAVITTLTAQNSVGVQDLHALPEDFVGKQLESILADIEVRAVKIGMLGTARIARLVVDMLERDPLPNVVLDPILRSSSGTELLDRRGVAILRERLLPLVRVVTPNQSEAASLSGMERVRDVPAMKEAAKRLHALGARAVVVKGGHLHGRAIDVAYDGNRFMLFDASKVTRVESRGLGCAFSSAIAAQLSIGTALHAAVDTAKRYVSRALLRARRIGRGRFHLDLFVNP